MTRIFGLDLLRAISIWLVLLQHAGFSVPGLQGPIQIGGIGVDVFFVLSGFLIGGILLRSLSKENSASSIKKFLIRRWFRILPVYYLCILLKFAFIDHSIGPNILYYIFFLQNNFYGIHFYSVTWSLVIEEWFYLFSPVFLSLMIFLFRQPVKILSAILLFILLENILRFLYVEWRDVPYAGINSSFPFRFDSLFLGVLIAYLKMFYSPLFSRLKSRFVFIAGFIIFIGYVIFIAICYGTADKVNHSVLLRTFGFFILDAGIALMLPFFDSLQQISQTKLSGKATYFFVTETSILTYSIYLLHVEINSFIYAPGNPLKSFYLQFISATAITYLGAYLMYRFFEKPILNLRERFA